MDPHMRGLLQRYLADRGPEWRGARVGELASLNVGWESDVYAFDLERTPRERQELVLRVYPGAYAREKAAGEFRVLRRLYEAPYPVPRVYECECDGSPFGRPFIIMERVRGENLDRLYDRADAAGRQRTFELFMGLFTRLHALDWRPFAEDPSAGEDYRSGALLRGTLNRLRRVLVEPFDVPGLDASLGDLEERASTVTPWPPALLHWDFHAGNILVREDGSPAVLDWASAGVSDPRFDLAWTLLLHHDAGAVVREETLRGYEALSGRRVEGLGWFEDLARWRRLASVAISMLYGAGSVGMRPGAEAMMRRHGGALRGLYGLLVERTGRPIPEVERLLQDMA